MEASDFSNVATSRGTAPGTPARWLVAAWHGAAEEGGPACLLVPRDGVLVLGWANRALSEMLGRDVADLAGHPLRELTEAEADHPAGDHASFPPPAGPQADLPPELAALLPAPGPAAEHPDDHVSTSVIGWARLAHQLAKAGGGAGVGMLRRVDAGIDYVRVTVRPVDAPDRADRPRRPDRADRADGADRAQPAGRAQMGDGAGGADRADRTGRTGRGDDLDASRRAGHVPAQGRGGHQAPVVEQRTSSGRGVPRPGTVGNLPAGGGAPCWYVEVHPVDDAVAEAEAAQTVAEHRFRALAGCAPIGIFASEAGLRLGYVNDFFVSLTGVPAHSLLGNGWLDVIHREDLPAVYTAIQTVLNGTAVELAVRRTTTHGVQRWLHLRLAPTTTPARAAGFIGTAEDVTERRSWEEHLTYQAQHDPLTGLVNRRRLIDVLSELLTGRRGRDRDFAVLFLDLDGFKEVNDTLGHEAGDRALIEVARRMQRVARESDLLARVAGDEFVVVLRHITSEAEAEAAARRHLAALADPVRLGSAEVRLSASVGVALPAGFDTPDSILRAADRVMYEAKAAGHGLYRLAPAGARERW